jgi:hypothetical protein
VRSRLFKASYTRPEELQRPIAECSRPLQRARQQLSGRRVHRAVKLDPALPCPSTWQSQSCRLERNPIWAAPSPTVRRPPSVAGLREARFGAVSRSSQLAISRASRSTRQDQLGCSMRIRSCTAAGQPRQSRTRTRSCRPSGRHPCRRRRLWGHRSGGGRPRCSAGGSGAH